MLRRTFLPCCLVAATFACAVVARADIDPLSGIDFAHIGSPGNAPWMGDGTSGDANVGRGSVSYEYNIGRFEVTTAQWTEFMNAAFDRPTGDQLPHVNAPAVWGAVQAAPNNPGRQRWSVPAGREMYPVGGVSWRTCAMYCNWLCNGKSSAASAFMNGAYDVSTFQQQGNGYSDQLTHNAGAQYWIPTQDEYLKAAHYDPNRFGAGQGGYWAWNNTLGRAAAAGPPGVGEANFGFATPNPFTIPLGSYPVVQSAFGLLDLAGATSEWNERGYFSGFAFRERGYEGSAWVNTVRGGDTVYSGSGSDSPFAASYEYGLRIASSVPAPGTFLVFAGVFASIGVHTQRKRRSCETSTKSCSLC